MGQVYTVLKNRWDDKDVDLKKTIRTFSTVSLVLGIIQLAITIASFVALTSPRVGAFWSSFFVIVTGLIGIFSVNKGIVLGCAVMAFGSVIVSLVGAVTDGTAADVAHTLQACAYTPDLYSLEDYKYSGSSTYQLNAAYCLTAFWKGKDSTCYCTNSESACYIYYGVAGNDCSYVMNYYKGILSAAASFDTLAMLSSLAIFMLTAVSSSLKPTKKAYTSKEAALGKNKPAPGTLDLTSENDDDNGEQMSMTVNPLAKKNQNRFAQA